MPFRTTTGRKPARADHGRPVTSRSLSHAQQQVLCWVWRWSVYLEARDDGDARRPVEQVAVAWRAGSGATAAQRASWSRTLRRLEQRGLLERIPHRDEEAPVPTDSRGHGIRTAHVRLTAAGKELAKRLEEGDGD